MNKLSKKKFTIVGNWKMNPDTLDEAKKLLISFKRKAVKCQRVNVVIAPPAVFLGSLKNNVIQISAQDVSQKQRGAFTGSISASEIKSVGATYTIIGHSERRSAGDTEEIILEKVKNATEAGLKVILCVGEQVRDEHAEYLHAIRGQIISVISKIEEKYARNITFAYEPIWAVGKDYNKVMKPSDIHEMSIYIKKVASEALGKTIGLKLPVLYGGSVNFENAKDILSYGAIDGLLIGRQSLDSEAFVKIIDYANNL